MNANQPGFLLPLILFLPLLGALLIMMIPREERGLARGVGIGFSLITFFASLSLIFAFDRTNPGFQFVFDVEWIEAMGTHFKLGIDGISLWLVVLTTFLLPIILLSANSSITKNVREFVALMLVLETGMLGAFVSLDLFVFYIFWELMLIPMYLLIGMWGGKRRLYASMKFVIYTMVGSLLMLVAIFYVYAQHGAVTGNYTTDYEALTSLVLPHNAQIYCFIAFALAFAIKIPLFPLHTWLPDAHVEAPTAGSVVLAGVLLKFGIYGFIRFAMPMFPVGAAELAPYIAILAAVGIVYGALVAFAQDDVKKLIAYSSVSHLGFCALGVFALTPQGVEGSIFGMISHGFTTSGLFLAVGVIYERRHTRSLEAFGGLWKQMPVFAAMFLICMLGSVGLPGLSGFVGEFLTIFGTFISGSEYFPAGYETSFIWGPKWLAVIAASGVIFGAIYLLYMFQKVMFGPLDNPENQNLPDLNLREKILFIPLVVMIFVMGIYPQVFLDRMEPSVNKFLTDYGKGAAEQDGPTRLKGEMPLRKKTVSKKAAAGKAKAPAGAQPAGKGPRGARPAGARPAGGKSGRANGAVPGRRPAGAVPGRRPAGAGQPAGRVPVRKIPAERLPKKEGGGR